MYCIDNTRLGDIDTLVHDDGLILQKDFGFPFKGSLMFLAHYILSFLSHTPNDTANKMA
jgi:hypothetical protein